METAVIFFLPITKTKFIQAEPHWEGFESPLGPQPCLWTGACHFELFPPVGQVWSARLACHWWNRAARPSMVTLCFGPDGSVSILCICSLPGRRLLTGSIATWAVVRCSRISDAFASFGSVSAMTSASAYLIRLTVVTLSLGLNCFLSSLFPLPWLPPEEARLCALLLGALKS